MSRLHLNFTVEPNVVLLRRTLLLRWETAQDLTDVFENIGHLIYEENRKQFATDGRNGLGQQWAALTDNPPGRGYQTRKRRDFKAGRIRFDKTLRRTGALMFSLLSGIDANAVFQVGPRSLAIGSAVKTKNGLNVAALHQTGTKRMTARPPMALSEPAKRRIIRMIQSETLKRVNGRMS